MAWCTADELREFDRSLADPARYTDAELTSLVEVVEAEIERHCGQAWNVRTVTDEFYVGDGTQVLRLRHRPLVAITAVTIDDTALDDLTVLRLDKDGGRVLYTGRWTWNAPVLVSYTHGEAAPPADLLFAAKLVVRGRLNQTRNPVTDRASKISPGDSTSWDVARTTPTGFPDADRIIDKYYLPGLA